ncbi:hypothetical protein GZA09_27570, partial [Escherichia coli]|nr:hypothetical protein [Escherichia coli]
MARRFRAYPEAIHASAAITERCTFSLRDLEHQYPEEQVIHGRTAQEALAALAWNGLKQKFAGKPSQAHRDLLTHELGLVEQMGYAPYF